MAIRAQGFQPTVPHSWHPPVGSLCPVLWCRMCVVMGHKAAHEFGGAGELQETLKIGCFFSNEEVLGIQSPPENGFMEPKYYAFQSWLDAPNHHFGIMIGFLGNSLPTCFVQDIEVCHVVVGFSGKFVGTDRKIMSSRSDYIVMWWSCTGNPPDSNMFLRCDKDRKPLKSDLRSRKGSSSNHHFWGVNSLLKLGGVMVKSPAFGSINSWGFCFFFTCQL